MRVLQMALCQEWDFWLKRLVILWDPCRTNLFISDQEWVGFLGTETALDLWSQEKLSSSINHKELRAIRLGLLAIQENIQNCKVALYCDNATAIACLRNQMRHPFESQLLP